MNILKRAKINKPKVSVIIPTYNTAQYITEAIDSVLNQTYEHYEIIVIDDGSTDNTKEALKDYKNKIKYIYKHNGGPASARNAGIKNSIGENIAFLDADDLWLPQKLEKQVEYFKTHPDVGLTFSAYLAFDENKSEKRPNIKEKIISKDAFINLWWDNFLGTLTVMVRKACFDKVGIFDESKDIEGSEDSEMWLRIARNYRMGYINEPLARYRIRTGGHNRCNVDRAYRAKEVVLKRYWSDVKERGNYSKKKINQRLSRHYFCYGMKYFTKGDLKRARHQLGKAIKYDLLESRGSIYFYLATFLKQQYIASLIRIKKKALNCFKGRFFYSL